MAAKKKLMVCSQMRLEILFVKFHQVRERMMHERHKKVIGRTI